MTDNIFLGWDVKTWSKALNAWELALDSDKKLKLALEVGSGSGGLSLWLAKKGLSVVCSDVCNNFDKARLLHADHNLEQQITYETIDGSEIPYENHFDVIVFKSVLGAIGRIGGFEHQKKAIDSIRSALKPGGILLFAENLNASPIHMCFRKKFVSWGNSWRYLTLDEMNELLTDFSEVSIDTTGFLATFGRSERQRRIVARIDGLAEKFVPNHWRYVVYGWARR